MSSKHAAALLTALLVVSMAAFISAPVVGGSSGESISTSDLEGGATVTDPGYGLTVDTEAETTDSVLVGDGVGDADGPTDVLIQVRRGDSLTPAETTPETLQAHAEKTQQPVLDALASFDSVEVQNQHWLGNIITADIDFDETSVEEITNIRGVRAVVENVEVEHPRQPNSNNSTDRAVEDTAAPADEEEFTYGLEQIDFPNFDDEFDAEGEGTTIAVLDDGLDTDHPDLDIVDGAVFVGGDPFGGPDAISRDTGHGDHVAGTAVGTSDPAGDVPRYSVAPEADLIKGDIFFATANVDNVVGAMEWAVENDADVISGSFGFPPSTSNQNSWAPAIADAVSDAKDAGTVVSISAGNEGAGDVGGPVTSPATEFNSFAVGATNEAGDVARFSSGAVVNERTAEFTPGSPVDFPDTYPREYIQPDVVAAGEDVLSAGPVGFSVGTGDAYSVASGTSFAQPHVAGAVALIQSATEQELEPGTIESALVETAEKPDDLPPRDIRFGTGVINVTAAAMVADDLATVSGEVTDNETGAELVQPTIDTGTGQIAGTDESGTYELSVNPNLDTVEIIADAFGYGQEVKLAELAPGNQRESLDTTEPTVDSRIQSLTSNVVLGDVSESGEVTIRDAVAIQRDSLGLDPGTPFNETLADVNRNGEVGIDDAVLAQRIGLGLTEGAQLTTTDLELVEEPARVGDAFVLTATVENVGDVGAIDIVELRADTDADLDEPAVRAQQSVDIGAEGTERAEQSVTFEVDTTMLEPGEYSYGVFTPEENKTAPETLELGPPETVPIDEPINFELEPTGAAELVGQTPAFATAGGFFDVVFESSQYDNVTFSLGDASTIDEDQISFFDGFPPGAEPGEPIPIDDGVQELSASFDADTEAGDIIQLELTFEGAGVEPTTIETGETELDDELDPPEFELSDLRPDDVLPIDEDGTIEPSVVVENIGQEPELVTINYRIGFVGVQPLTSEFLDGRESAEINETLEGLGRADLFLPEVGDTVEHRFDALRPTDLGLPTRDDRVETDVLLVRADTAKYDIESIDTPGSAAPGEAIDIGADVLNIGELNRTQDINLLFDGEVSATEQFATDSGTVGTAVFEDVVVPDEPGFYTHGVETEDDDEQVPITVGESGVTGTVTDSLTGDRVEETIVELEGTAGVTVQDTTDENGVYAFENLPAGTYIVNVAQTPDGYQQEAVVTVGEGETAEQDFTIEPFDPVVTGTVTEIVEDSPLSNVTIMDGDQTGTDPGAGEFGPFETDEDGEFSFQPFEEGLERGETIALQAVDDRIENSRLNFVDIGPGENEADFEVVPEPRISFDDQAITSAERLFAAVTTAEAGEIEIIDSESGVVVGSEDIDPRFEDSSTGVDIDPDAIQFREHDVRLIGEDGSLLAEDTGEVVPQPIKITNITQLEEITQDEIVEITADLTNNYGITAGITYRLRANETGEPLDEDANIDIEDDFTLPSSGETVEISGELDVSELDAEPGDALDYGLFAPEVDSPGTLRTPNATATFEVVDPGPNFELSELEPETANVNPGDELNVSATVTNTGDLSGNQSIVLEIDDEVVRSQNISLDSGESTTVTFVDVEAPDEADRYVHAVVSEDDRLTGELAVRPPR